MTLTKYQNVFDDIGFPRSLGLLDELFRQAPASAAVRAQSGGVWTPAVDIVEGEQSLSVRTDLPGLKEEDIEVKVENGTLTIKGKREFQQEENGKGYHRIERSYGSFSRVFGLPETVDPDKVTAQYKNGVLDVVFAKREAAKPKSVKVAIAS
jgi:HSP20 family protein